MVITKLYSVLIFEDITTSFILFGS